MNHSASIITLIALAASASAAAAADTVVYQEPAPAPVVESRIKGAFEIGGSALRFSQTDDDVTDTLWGAYGAGFVNVALTPRLIWSADSQIEYLRLGEDEDWDDNAPNLVGVFGSSINVGFGNATIGAFGSLGATSQYNEEDSFGWTGGLLATYDLTAATTLTGHAGWADIRVDRDDSGFTGYFLGASAIHAFSDRFALSVNGGYGYADDGFEDSSGWGRYWNAGVKGAFRVSSDLPLFATAGYEYGSYKANDEDDGDEHAFRIGLAMAFGGGNTARDTFNNFQTPTTPYRAAAWGEVLD